MLREPEDKDALVEMVTSSSSAFLKLLCEIEEYSHKQGEKGAEHFEGKYFRAYVFIVDSYLRRNRGEIETNLSSHIAIASKMSYIYAHLGRLEFQKQAVFMKKVV